MGFFCARSRFHPGYCYYYIPLSLLVSYLKTQPSSNYASFFLHCSICDAACYGEEPILFFHGATKIQLIPQPGSQFWHEGFFSSLFFYFVQESLTCLQRSLNQHNFSSPNTQASYFCKFPLSFWGAVSRRQTHSVTLLSESTSSSVSSYFNVSLQQSSIVHSHHTLLRQSLLTLFK